MQKDAEKIDWTKEVVYALIEQWEKHKLLYNPNHNFYYNRRERNKVLQKIADTLKEFFPNIEANDVKLKITYLRGQYSKEVGKLKVNKSYKPSAFWYKKLHFLKSYIKERIREFDFTEDIYDTPTVSTSLPKKARIGEEDSREDHLEEDNTMEDMNNSITDSEENEPNCEEVSALSDLPKNSYASNSANIETIHHELSSCSNDSMQQRKIDWSKKAVLRLIEQWQKHRCLYDTIHECYHNKNKRDEALKNITQSVKEIITDIDQNDVKLKLNYLRGHYSRELAKERGNKSCKNIKYKSAVYWFPKLHFLESYIKTYNRDSNLFNETNLIEQHTREDPLDAPLRTSPSKVVLNDDSSNGANPMISDSEPESSIEMPNNLNENSNIKIQPNSSNYITNSSISKNIAFCNYIQAEMSSITTDHIRDELCEEILSCIFDAKRKERQLQKKKDKNLI